MKFNSMDLTQKLISTKNILKDKIAGDIEKGGYSRSEWILEPQNKKR